MIYRIYPPIAIARIGNSQTEFFIASESADSNGTELLPGGSEAEVTEYKTGDTGNPLTSFQVKKQAARFRLFEFDDENSPGRPANLPAGSTIKWSVQLLNKKDAVNRPADPPATTPTSIDIVNGRQNRIIDSGLQSISSTSTQVLTLSGTYLGNPVTLGAIRTDGKGNLLVLGGHGQSRTFEAAPIGASFYNNPGWHDDLSDGPVTATIVLADQTELNETIVPAWVVVAPPDFAPAVRGMVTLYDIILQNMLNENPSPVTIPVTPSFSRDILPMIMRARGLRWVHDDATWANISDNFARLADPGTGAAATRRRNVVNAIRRVETVFDHADYNFNLCRWQIDYLNKYLAGGNEFISDFGTPPAVLPESALTRAVLDGTVGEGFFPGIEAGRFITRQSLYRTPFTFHLDHSKVKAGDLTALMALPWQADFLKCNTGWWPSQRPNKIPGTAPRQDWDRGISSHQDLVDNALKLGVITRRPDVGGNEVQEESRRDPSLT